MNELANLIMFPFRLIKSLFETFVMTFTILILLFITPVLSFFTMIGYQHDANQSLTHDSNRIYLLYDFSDNSGLCIPWENLSAFPFDVPTVVNYKSTDAALTAQIPDDWAFWNLVGFYSEPDIWMRGKQAPMYSAYVQAATTSDALRAALSQAQKRERNSRHHRIILPDAPKIMMAWRDSAVPIVTLSGVLFGVSPAGSVGKEEDLRFKEAHELFTPAFTEGQQVAMKQMMDTLSDDYWLREAHANGIQNEDEFIRDRAQDNRHRLGILYHQPAPAYWMVGLELAYFSFALFLFLRLVKRLLFWITF